MAISGDATVSDNTVAGNATTGNSTDTLNIVNELASLVSLGTGSGISTFSTNVDGTVDGNINIDPSQLAQLTSATTPTVDPNLNASLDSSITNNANLNAKTGDAKVQNNGTAGNATSGAANAVANVVNMINSIIAAQESFIGEINIYGNLDGNILLPAQLVSSLLNDPTSGVGGGALNLSNNQTVVNNINLAASSGTATVMNNGVTGNATSGSAKTDLTLFNLTGDRIVASNALLVIVNVLGQWYGLIMNAPAGSHSALLGGGVTQDSVIPPAVNATVHNNAFIDNSLNLRASTGNATVLDNGTAGNATTGNASASANVINILGDQFDLSGWFGILFVNVFGSWEGNLSTYNELASVLNQVGTPSANNTNYVTQSFSGNSNNGNSTEYTAVYKVVSDNSNTNSNTNSNSTHNDKGSIVLASNFSKHAPSILPTTNASSQTNWSYVLAAIGLSTGTVLFGIERYLTYRQNKLN